MTWSAVSNSVGFESWEMSPVWSTNAGRRGSRLSRSTASCRVAVTSGLASLANPMWLSLI